MNTNEFKRELSKLSGIDFFNPKYRELFKKAFPEEKPQDDERLKDADTEDEIDEKPVQDSGETKPEEKEIPKQEEDIEETEDECEPDQPKDEEPDAEVENGEAREREEPQEICAEEATPKDHSAEMLLDAKIENALLRGGVREEKLGAAMRLAKSEIKSIEELDRVGGILQDFPEWTRGYNRRGFGMDVDNGSDNLTEEEKRLKAMGINPRD